MKFIAATLTKTSLGSCTAAPQLGQNFLVAGTLDGPSVDGVASVETGADWMS